MKHQWKALLLAAATSLAVTGILAAEASCPAPASPQSEVTTAKGDIIADITLDLAGQHLAGPK